MNSKVVVVTSHPFEPLTLIETIEYFKLIKSWKPRNTLPLASIYGNIYVFEATLLVLIVMEYTLVKDVKSTNTSPISIVTRINLLLFALMPIISLNVESPDVTSSYLTVVSGVAAL